MVFTVFQRHNTCQPCSPPCLPQLLPPKMLQTLKSPQNDSWGAKATQRCSRTQRNTETLSPTFTQPGTAKNGNKYCKLGQQRDYGNAEAPVEITQYPIKAFKGITCYLFLDMRAGRALRCAIPEWLELDLTKQPLREGSDTLLTRNILKCRLVP